MKLTLNGLHPVREYRAQMCVQVNDPGGRTKARKITI